MTFCCTAWWLQPSICYSFVYELLLASTACCNSVGHEADVCPVCLQGPWAMDRRPIAASRSARNSVCI